MKNLRLLFFLAILTIGLSSCARKVVYNDPIPPHKSFSIQSRYLGELRLINVWLPRNYKELKDLTVLYMPDGGIKEDFPHIANTVASLVDQQAIEPIILVGIENTNRYRDLSGFSEVEADAKYCPLSDGAKNFRAFILKELVPKIESDYKVSGRKAIIGESLAGLFVTETLLNEPEAFDYYIAMDPSLWWNNHALTRNAAEKLAHFPHSEITYWFAGSDAPDISQYTHSLSETLKKSAPPSLRWQYLDQPKEKHYTIFRATKEQALIWTFGSKEKEAVH